MKLEYPYIVRRVMNAVYAKSEVGFDESKNEVSAFNCSCKIESIFGSNRFVEDVANFLVSTLKNDPNGKQFRHCIVLNQDDCIYLEPDGSTERSRQMPSSDVAYDLDDVRCDHYD